MTPLTAPTPLGPDHLTSAFDSGERSLDDWLKKRALRNNASGASRCFVVCTGLTVVGFYSLSASAISRETVPKGLARNMPDPLPALLLGRLAVDSSRHNQGLGRALLRDAMIRAAHLSQETGVALILLHAISEPAKQFYLSRGFVISPIQPMTLMMSLATVRQILVEVP